MAAYKFLQDSKLPNDVIELIAKKVHAFNFADTKAAIEARRSKIEEEVLDDASLNLDKLKDIYPELEVFRLFDLRDTGEINDDPVVFYYLDTIVLKLNKIDFVMYHADYRHEEKDNILLAEGKYQNDSFIFTRFEFYYNYNRKRICNFNKYIKRKEIQKIGSSSQCQRWLSFKFLAKAFDINHYKRQKYISNGKSWKAFSVVRKWFENTWEISDLNFI